MNEFMTVVDCTDLKNTKTTLNNVPNGQWFRGEITSTLNSTRYRGVFWKVAVEPLTVVAVDVIPPLPVPGASRLFAHCVEVRDYEPLFASVSVQPTKVRVVA